MVSGSNKYLHTLYKSVEFSITDIFWTEILELPICITTVTGSTLAFGIALSHKMCNIIRDAVCRTLLLAKWLNFCILKIKIELHLNMARDLWETGRGFLCLCQYCYWKTVSGFFTYLNNLQGFLFPSLLQAELKYISKTNSRSSCLLC